MQDTTLAPSAYKVPLAMMGKLRTRFVMVQLYCHKALVWTRVMSLAEPVPWSSLQWHAAMPCMISLFSHLLRDQPSLSSLNRPLPDTQKASLPVRSAALVQFVVQLLRERCVAVRGLVVCLTAAGSAAASTVAAAAAVAR